MLIEFSVANFLSFKEKTTFSMLASHDKTLPQNVIHNAQGSGIDLLKSAVIYGANASGKSNFIKAIQAMRTIVLSFDSSISDSELITPFKLDSSYQNKPRVFETIMLIEGTQFTYGFKFDKEFIHEEWLYSYPKSQKRELFHRTQYSPGSEATYKFNKTHFKGENKTIESMTSENSLFLGRAARLNHKSAKLVFDWFKVAPFYFDYREEHDVFFDFQRVLEYLTSKPDIKNQVAEFIRLADIDIEAFDIGDAFRRSSNFNEIVSSKTLLTFRSPKNRNKKGKKILFHQEEESKGTLMMLTLITVFLHSLDQGKFLEIDELDNRLHPNLARWLIELFHNEKYNNKGAQLIFTSHNAGLLEKDVFRDNWTPEENGELFRRDQIWFAEKDFKTGATSMYSLWDFKNVRADENKKANYIAGRYGAIPFLMDDD